VRGPHDLRIYYRTPPLDYRTPRISPTAGFDVSGVVRVSS